ncbi:DUF2333 family protein [Pokkaliibacter sp. CJK22405]|uniref:DUF2333 family protein n=1 Tax=Pokkaliibacter sp. CJK22405 TaxID=3384615 RepID=UPI003984D098
MFDRLLVWLYPEGGRTWIRWVVAAILLYLLGAVVIGIYWSGEPDGFDPQQSAKAAAAKFNQNVVPGYTTTHTLIHVAEEVLDKPGGYLSNDVFPPGVWLDNTRSWEFGAVVQIRDMARALRKDFSRSQSQSREQPDLAKAEPQFSFAADSWMLPSTESQYREGVGDLYTYLGKLSNPTNGNAEFYGRADNLSNWLGDVSTRLGSLSQRLSASVGQRVVNSDGDENPQTSSTSEVKTPWLEIDNVFYEARGTTWALLEFLRAVEVDFGPALAKKNALVSLRQVIRELEGTQETVWSPVILNGSGFGLFANHSLVMANYISRANAAIIDLRELLARG